MTRSARARGAGVLLLAHLFQGLIAARPLEIARACPAVFDPDDFSRLLAFVIDALPLRYAHRCRSVVLPSRSAPAPGQRQGRTQADLLLLDADRAPPGPGVLRVDEDGEPLAGDGPEAMFLDYAEAVIAGALARPDALVAFAERFDRLLDGDDAPTAETLALTDTVYALSALFAAPTVGAPGTLRRHLLPLASDPNLPWSVLVEDLEWRSLNTGDLSAWILAPASRLAVGERALQDALVTGLVRAGWQLDDPSPPWRRPADTGWWDRLRELLVVAPGLLPPGLSADLGRGVSLDEVPASALVTLLSAEQAGGTLWRRRWQVDELVAACAEPDVLPILLDASAQGELDMIWLKRLTCDEGVLSRLSAEQLLRIGTFEEIPADGKERVCRAVDRCMNAEDPSDAVAALIKTGGWSVWRRGTVLTGQRRRVLAFAWMTHPLHRASRSDLRETWTDSSNTGSSADRQCSIEDWRYVVADLGGGLTAAEVRALFDSGRCWPLIYPYGREQIADLAALCVDLDALAELVEGIGDALGEPDLEGLLGASRFSVGLSADTFAWLLAAGTVPGPGPSAPTLKETALLCKGVRERAGDALDAREAAVSAELERDLLEGLKAAREPSLWDRSEFRERVRQLLLQQLLRTFPMPDRVREVDQELDRAGIPPMPGASATTCDPVVRRLVCDLVGDGRNGIARLIAGGDDLPHRCRLLHRVLRALNEGAPGDPAWADLAGLCVSTPRGAGAAEPHPLTELAELSRCGRTQGPEETTRVVLQTLTQALAGNPVLLYPTTDGNKARLPLLHLVAALSGSAAGTLLPELITGAACSKSAQQPAWQRAAVTTLQDPGEGPLSEIPAAERGEMVDILENHWKNRCPSQGLLAKHLCVGDRQR